LSLLYVFVLMVQPAQAAEHFHRQYSAMSRRPEPARNRRYQVNSGWKQLRCDL